MAAGVAGSAHRLDAELPMPTAGPVVVSPEAQRAALEIELASYEARIRRIEAKGPQVDRLSVDELKDRIRQCREAIRTAGGRERRPAGFAVERRA